MIAFGIDPGLAETGWGCLEILIGRVQTLGWGVIHTNPKEDPAARLFSLHTQLVSLLDQFKPEVCGIETLFFSKNISSALPVAQARGVLLFTLFQKHIKVEEFAPNQIKKTVTGIAKAEKHQVQMMMKTLLKLDEIPKPNHAADALAVAYCSHQFGGVLNVS